MDTHKIKTLQMRLTKMLINIVNKYGLESGSFKKQFEDKDIDLKVTDAGLEDINVQILNGVSYEFLLRYKNEINYREIPYHEESIQKLINGVSKMINKKAFKNINERKYIKKLNELYDNSSTKAEYYMKTIKTLNMFINKYDLFDASKEEVSLLEELKKKGIDINLNSIFIHDNIELLDIIIEKSVVGYGYSFKIRNNNSNEVSIKPLEKFTRKKILANIFNYLSKEFNEYFLKNLNK